MSDGITIRTNNQWRPVLNWWDLTRKEQAEFDYLDTEEKQYEATFVRYRKCVYHTGDIVAIDHRVWGINAEPFANWHGYVGDSFFSGIVILYNHEDPELVKMGTYFS